MFQSSHNIEVETLVTYEFDLLPALKGKDS